MRLRFLVVHYTWVYVVVFDTSDGNVALLQKQMCRYVFVHTGVIHPHEGSGAARNRLGHCAVAVIHPHEGSGDFPTPFADHASPSHPSP
jgi:hypothetical protein